MRRTEVEDNGGRVVVETRIVGMRVWETTITPGDAPDPDGPEAAVFATVDTWREAQLAHLQAQDFAAAALELTARATSSSCEKPPSSISEAGAPSHAGEGPTRP